MQRYVVRRILVAVPTLVGATLLVFLLLRVLPGDVAKMVLFGRGGEGAFSARNYEQLRRELGLDRPLAVQFVTWYGDVFRGSFGNSLWNGRPVGREILHRLPLTLEIAVLAQLIAIPLGLAIGTVSAIRQDTWLDYLLRVWSILFLATPSFWLGLLVLLVGVSLFRWMPPIGYYSLWEDPWNNLRQLIWPALILASHEMARVARLVRSSMLEVMREDYIRTARAKGITELMVIQRHALKNALLPAVTLVAISFGHQLGGAVVLERV